MTLSDSRRLLLEIGHRARLIDRSLLHAKPSARSIALRRRGAATSNAERFLSVSAVRWDLRRVISEISCSLASCFVGFGLHSWPARIRPGSPRSATPASGDSFSSCTRRFSSAASAECSASRALSASCSTSRVAQFEDDRVRARPARPAGEGSARRVHWFVEGSHRVSSGTRVPRPRMLPDDRATFDGVHQDGRPFDCWRGGFHPRQRDRYGDHDEDADGGVERMPSFLRFRIAGSRTISGMVPGFQGQTPGFDGQSVCHRCLRVRYFVHGRLNPISRPAPARLLSACGTGCSAFAQLIRSPPPRRSHRPEGGHRRTSPTSLKIASTIDCASRWRHRSSVRINPPSSNSSPPTDRASVMPSVKSTRRSPG